MALSSLYILMTKHGLEYPNFYEKLYVLLVPSIFMAKHRARFFELLDSCLKSPLLPAYLAAAFAKKLSSLSLLVPLSGALVIIALMHNLLRSHPSINCLVHWEDGDGITKDDSQVGKDDDQEDSGNSSREPGIDYFNNEETNPVKTNAMRSTLWEIDTLRHHYCPPVSRFVLSLENDLTVKRKTTELTVTDFSSGSYATTFGEVPLAFYKATPTSLFSDSDFPGWIFNYEKIDNSVTGSNKNVDISEDHDHSLAGTKDTRITRGAYQSHHTWAAVLKSMRASCNTRNIDSEVARGRNVVRVKLAQLQKQVQLFDFVHYLKAFGVGDEWMAVGWSSDVLPATKRMNNVVVIVPKSGASLWADLWAVPATSRFATTRVGGRIRGRSLLVYQWLDFWLQAARAMPFQQEVIPGASPSSLEKGAVEEPKEFSKGKPNLDTNLIAGVPLLRFWLLVSFWSHYQILQWTITCG